MKTYTRRKQKTTTSPSEDVFFKEKAFKSPLELSTDQKEDVPETSKNSKDTPRKNTANGKRKPKEASGPIKKKPKTKVGKKPIQGKKSTRTSKSAQNKDQVVIDEGMPLEKDVSKEIASLPVLKESSVDKVRSWLENSVEGGSPSDSYHSIEKWRDQSQTARERDKSLSPDLLYENLTKCRPVKKPEVKKDTGAEINAFLQSLKRPGTPIRRPIVYQRSVRTKDPVTESEPSSYTDDYYTQSALQTSKQSDSTEFETATHLRQKVSFQSSTPLCSTMCITETQTNLQSGTQSSTPLYSTEGITETQTNLQSGTQSSTRLYYTEGITETQTNLQSGTQSSTPLNSTEGFTETQTNLQSGTQSSTPLYSTEGITETQINLQSGTQSSTPLYSTKGITETQTNLQSETQSSKQRYSSDFETMTSSNCQTDTQLSTQSGKQPSTCLSSVGIKRRVLQEITPNKPTEFKFPKSKRTSAKSKKIPFINPKTSTRLFDGDTVNIEEAFSGMSTIISYDDTNRKIISSEKTPDKPSGFKSPKSPKKVGVKEKSPHHGHPKTSTRLFDGDTMNIEDDFPRDSTIKNERPIFKDENTDFLFPVKSKAPVKTSTPQGKRRSGESLHFEMDISSVNEDSDDDGIGLHINQSCEVNSDEIVCLSSPESLTKITSHKKVEDKDSRRKSEDRKQKSAKLTYSSNSRSTTNTPSNNQREIMLSVKKTGFLYNCENISNVPVCPLTARKFADPIKRGFGCRKPHWQFVSPAGSTGKKDIPLDILCRL